MNSKIKKLLGAAMAGFAALSSQAQSYSNAVVALHPVAYYPLSETATTPVSSVLSLTNYGTDTNLNMPVTSDVIFGYPGALASQPGDTSDFFNGGNSHAIAPYDSSLANPPPFTIEGWFLDRSVTSTQCPTSDFDANNGAVTTGRSGWLIYMDISNPGQYSFRTYNQANNSPTLTFNIGAAGSIAPDKWYHLAVVVDASANVTGYINGVLVSGPTAIPSYIPNDGLQGGLSAGCRADGGFGFIGNIDELAYYTNALSGATILSHYQAATNLSPVTPYDQLVLQQHPLAYYRFNEAAPPFSSPYPLPLPVAKNYGSYGTNANGFYTADSAPGAAAGPTNSGFGGLQALQLNVSDTPSATTAGPGMFADPFNSEEFNITNALSVAFWAQLPAHSSYFETVMGRGDGSWRFDADASGLPHWAAAPNSDLVGTTSVGDNLWHYWAGVYDPVAGVGTLYIDGVAVARAPWVALSSSLQYPLLIGGAPDYWNAARNFFGNIAQVAIFTNALTQAQVNSLYASVVTPATVGVLITSITIDEGSNTNIAATAGGTLPIGIQWYYTDTNAATFTVTGATNLTLNLTNVLFNQNGNQYFAVASNAYGMATSAPVTLNVIAGPPTIQTDVSPLLSQLPVGVGDQFSVSVTGSQPFFYHWYVNTAQVLSATNPAYAFTVASGTNTYSVIVSNASGAVTSSVATVTGLTTAPPVITFGDGSNWTTNSSAGAGSAFPQFNGAGSLLLTDGNNNEAASAFYIFPQYIGGFVASFTYVETNGSADGAAFVVQNAPAGTNALGAGGGALAYYGIGNSAAFELNLYTGSSGGTGIEYGTDGATPSSPIPLPPYLPITPVSLLSGDPINVRLAYVGGTMYAKLTDATSGATYTGSHTFGDLVSIVGSASAYVGFTGATGGLAAIQAVSNFSYSYTTAPVLSLTTSNNSAIVTWPISVSALFALQQSTVVTGPYTNVTTSPIIVNGNNQITVPVTGNSQFFRLILP